MGISPRSIKTWSVLLLCINRLLIYTLVYYSGQQLGAGCFGRVLKAEADGIVHQAVTQTVAVKMVRSFTDLSALASLVSELKILIHLGSQLNIVNLLGACTDIGNGISFIAMTTIK